jgi:hypothetical protein
LPAVFLCLVSCQRDPSKILLEAVTTGEQAKIQALIKEGADVNTVDENGDTPLIIAARSGNVDAIGVLLAAGANRDVSNKGGETPGLAAWKHFWEMKDIGRPRASEGMLQQFTPVITELRAVRPDPPGVSAQATIRFHTSRDGTLLANVSSRWKYSEEGGESFDTIRGLYFPGVVHEFSGSNKMPIAPAEIRSLRSKLPVYIFSVGPKPLAQVLTERGWIMKDGEAAQAAEWEIEFNEGAKVATVEAWGSETLAFTITQEGYIYTAGVGTILTPEGVHYELPASGFAKWLTTRKPDQ